VVYSRLFSKSWDFLTTAAVSETSLCVMAQY
jgi:hypothetical protein